MPKKKNPRKYLYLVLATLVVFATGFSVIDKSNARMQPPTAQEICQQTSAQIKEITATASSCSTDADCVFMPIACSMGCPAVNRTDEAKIKELLESRTNCMCTMEACMPAEATCQEGICKIAKQLQ